MALAMTKITHSAAKFGLRQVIPRKLEYPLVTTTFTLQQCMVIVHPILSQELPSARFVWSFPRVSNDTWTVGRLKYHSLTYEATNHSCEYSLRQLDDITRSLIQVYSLQLEAGISGNIFRFPEQVHEYLTPTWLSHTWVACHAANIQIIGMVIPFSSSRKVTKKESY